MPSMPMISSIIIFVLCLLSLSTSGNAGRHIGIINKVPQNITYQNPTKSLEMEITKMTMNIPSSQAHATLSDQERQTKVIKAERNMKAMSQTSHSVQELKVMKRKERQGHEARVRHSKGSKSKFPKDVSWRVPQKRKGVPDTGFNIDYAPPKVHPPTHN